jgi:hypothetical protein
VHIRSVIGGRQCIKACKQESDTCKLGVVTGNLLLDKRTYNLRVLVSVEATYRLFGKAVAAPLAYAVARVLRIGVLRHVAG